MQPRTPAQKVNKRVGRKDDASRERRTNLGRFQRADQAALAHVQKSYHADHHSVCAVLGL